MARARWKKGGKLAISGANKIKNALKKQKRQVRQKLYYNSHKIFYILLNRPNERLVH